MMRTRSFLLIFLAFLFSLVACNPADVDEDSLETETAVPTEPTKSPTETPTEIPTETPLELTEELLNNMTYQGIYDEPVTLTKGLYEGEPFEEGGASKPTVTLIPFTAFGDLNNDGVNDAAVLLVENSGGTGYFVYLAAVLNNEGTPESVSTLLLGDRVAPESVIIANGEIIVEADTHAEDDPLCCPSLKTRTTYGLQDGALTAVHTEELTVVEETAVPDELLGPWYWLAFQDSADGAESNDIIVPNPAKYTLEFLADGTAQIQADCNSGSSQITLEGSSLTFAPGPMTLAECDPGSLYNEYLARLGDVVTYVFDEDGNLVLNLKVDAGNMIFSREALSITAARPLGDLNIQLDAQGVAASWNWQVVPETPYDQSLPPGPVGLPAHIELLFDGADRAAHVPGDPILYLIPVEAYRQLWNEAGNTAVANALSQIADRATITNLPGSVAALPFEAIGGINDLTVQLGRAVPFGQLNETSATQSGYRFIGRWAQDANPVTNQGLTYVYQGFTNDGRYLVSFFYPITTEALPAIEDVPQEEFDRLTNDYDAYMTEKIDLLNSLDSADFSPTLEALDALVASLQIEPMPLSGLQDKTWQWTSGPAQPGSSESITIENPELYQVTYRSDGMIEITADCNHASMSYELNQGGLNGSMLATPGLMTLAECGPDSHYQAFINSLEAAQGYRVHPGGNELSLILPASGGILSLVAAP
ncbi:MAG: hypothetical protein DHS20C20_00040 [Ardenticatenaceae bacterium]|nr:MAG: hypothetical protein DHS20C20_00040 [Ardenticatenaceae bacterium]